MPEPYPSQQKPRVTARLDEALYAAVRELAGTRTIEAVVGEALRAWVAARRAPAPAVAPAPVLLGAAFL
jgi:Arc/MetJ family transcription regulator